MNATKHLPSRASGLALALLGGLVLASLALLAHGALAQKGAVARLDQTAEMVRALGLTDYAWFTEARYARHLSQADSHAAFQDGPVAMEHFPAGSLVAPTRATQPSGFSEPPALL